MVGRRWWARKGLGGTLSANSRNPHDRHISLPSDIQAGLDEFLTTVKNSLLSGPPVEIEFPASSTLRHWPVEEIERERTPGSSTGSKTAGTCARFSLEPERALGHPSMRGRSLAGNWANGSREHLVDNKGTSSKLTEVKREVSNGSRIAISYVMIKPGNLRGHVEKRIISEERGRSPGRLSWNRRC